MKSINAILIICLITFATLSHGQYKINKTKYNAQMYSPHIGDPFNPVVAGITSYLIPGLGQVYSGETRRGLTFLGGAMGCLLVFVKGVDSAIQENTGYGYIIAGLGGYITIDVWSIVDAVKVAKVNNIAFRDGNKTHLQFQIHPYFGSLSNQNSDPIGLTLKVKFY